MYPLYGGAAGSDWEHRLRNRRKLPRASSTLSETWFSEKQKASGPLNLGGVAPRFALGVKA